MIINITKSIVIIAIEGTTEEQITKTDIMIEKFF